MYPMTDRQQADQKINTLRREAREYSLYRTNRNTSGSLRNRTATILRRTAEKMSPEALEAAGCLPLSAEGAELLQRAVATTAR